MKQRKYRSNPLCPFFRKLKKETKWWREKDERGGEEGWMRVREKEWGREQTEFRLLFLFPCVWMAVTFQWHGNNYEYLYPKKRINVVVIKRTAESLSLDESNLILISLDRSRKVETCSNPLLSIFFASSLCRISSSLILFAVDHLNGSLLSILFYGSCHLPRGITFKYLFFFLSTHCQINWFFI